MYIFVPRVGLDKITLNNVTLRAVTDWNKLITETEIAGKGEFEPATQSFGYYLMESGQTIRKIVLSEEGNAAKFWDLRFGYEYGPYGQIELSPRNVYGENFHNMTVEILQKHLLDLTEYLDTYYGIIVDFTCAEYKSMEINVTFPLIGKYETYRRAVMAIISNVPYKKKIGRHSEEENMYIKDHEAYVGNRSLEVKIYNKSKKSIDEKDLLPDDVSAQLDYMRIEFCLLKKEVIKRHFGTAGIGSITQDDVEEAYKALFDSRIKRAHQIWKASSERILKSKVKAAYKRRTAHGGRWISALLEMLRDDELRSQYPIVLASEQLEEEIKELPIKHNNLPRTLRSLRMKDKGIFEVNGLEQIAEITRQVESTYRKGPGSELVST